MEAALEADAGAFGAPMKGDLPTFEVAQPPVGAAVAEPTFWMNNRGWIITLLILTILAAACGFGY